jgi:hypothetical protein
VGRLFFYFFFFNLWNLGLPSVDPEHNILSCTTSWYGTFTGRILLADSKNVHIMFCVFGGQLQLVCFDYLMNFVLLVQYLFAAFLNIFGWQLGCEYHAHKCEKAIDIAGSQNPIWIYGWSSVHFMVRFKLFVLKSHASCWNSTRACVNHTLACRNHTREYYNHTHTCQNYTVR